METSRHDHKEFGMGLEEEKSMAEDYHPQCSGDWNTSFLIVVFYLFFWRGEWGVGHMILIY